MTDRNQYKDNIFSQLTINRSFVAEKDELVRVFCPMNSNYTTGVIEELKSWFSDQWRAKHPNLPIPIITMIVGDTNPSAYASRKVSITLSGHI